MDRSEFTEDKMFPGVSVIESQLGEIASKQSEGWLTVEGHCFWIKPPKNIIPTEVFTPLEIISAKLKDVIQKAYNLGVKERVTNE